MPILIDEYKVAYYPTPKVAHTSIKVAFIELITGKKWLPPEAHARWPNTTYKFATAPPGYFKFALVRDPIARFASGYQQATRALRMALRQRQQIPFQQSRGPRDAVVTGAIIGRRTRTDPLERMKPLADLKSVIVNLDEYRKEHSSLRVHTHRQSYHIGDSLAYFDCVLPIERIHELVPVLHNACGITLPLYHENLDDLRPQLDDEDRAILTKWYETDYELLESFY